MGIWRQRIEGSWLKCTGNNRFRIINLKGGTTMDNFITAVSLKHSAVDSLISSGIGDTGNGTFSYPIDYYFGPSITDTKLFNTKKNYQFKTHVINFAYMDDSVRDSLNYDLRLDTQDSGVVQPNSNLYNSELDCFKGSLGIDTSWGDLHFFNPPYYKSFATTPMSDLTPTTHLLYYYSSPSEDTESGYVTFTNKLKENATQSISQSTYGISGVEINEIGWKIQGYSFVSYDNNPSINDIEGFGITNSYSGDGLPNSRVPLKYAVYGKGWYYDDLNNEYTWYHRIFNNILDENNNPVGGDTGFQESHEGYIENNYIAKYIPFQKFNISFLYENLRTDSGIKIYLSPTLPTSKPLESSKYIGELLYPPIYTTSPTNPASSAFRGFLVNNSSQIEDGGLTLPGGTTYSFSTGDNVYAHFILPLGTPQNYFAFSTLISDSKFGGNYISNNIYVDDDSNSILNEIKVNLTLRHTSIGDLIINLRAPNGNVINLKAKDSGESFNDLRNITFTTKSTQPKMKDLAWWPNGSSLGYIWDPIGIDANPHTGTTASGPSYPLKAPWLPIPYDFDYNFKWSQVRIRSGLVFQMDKMNGEGGTANLVTSPPIPPGGATWSNTIDGSNSQTIDFRSNVNDLKYLLNNDGTFNGTYSLYIKDDVSGNSGILEDWNIEFLYKKVYTPILTLTQSDPSNAVNKGAPKLQYLFGLEGNQYLFIVGDKLTTKDDDNGLSYLLPSLKNLKIDGGFHDANNRLYLVDDDLYGINNNINGGNTFGISDIDNISYYNYVGSGDVNNTTTLSLSGVSSKMGNGRFKSGIWENGVWNSGWRKDDNLQEFYNIDQFFSYNRDKTWRFSIFGSQDATSKFSIGDKVSMGNIVAIDVNEERKLIKGYFTIVAKTIDSISVEFDSDFPIRRIKVDSSLHRIYVTKNVWLSGAFLNGYFTGVWNNGLFRGFPYITEMFNSHWIDGTFNGGHFYSRKKSIEFSNTYLANYNTIKVGLIFSEPHRLTEGDDVTISSTFSMFGETKVLSIVDDYKLIVDLEWDSSRDPNTYGGVITGTVNTNISTGLAQNLNFSANNVSSVTSLQSMDNTRVFMYDSWMDVNFDVRSAVNIGKPQSKIDNKVSSYSYSENNLYGYPTYDILSSDVTFRDSFSSNIRKYKLGSKYKIYQDYIGDAGSFDEYFDVTGWATSNKEYPTNTPPFSEIKSFGDELPISQSFENQGWVINKDSNTESAISFERTNEALNDEDVVAGKEMKVESIGKGGVLNIQHAYDVPNRTNSTIERMRYTIVKFDLLKSLVPDFIFEDSSSIYTDSSKYQPLIHFNNLNYVTRKIYNQGGGYSNKILDATYLPVYKNVNHVETSNNTKIEYFYNKRNLSMYFRGNGLDGQNLSEFVVDNLKLYEVDMIPFFQYFTLDNINKSVSIPYQGVAPHVEYVDSDYSLIDKSIYGIDSFYIFQPITEATIQNESVALAEEFSLRDPVINNTIFRRESGVARTAEDQLRELAEQLEQLNGDETPSVRLDEQNYERE